MAVPASSSVIALLSDFGINDPYVGCMKGAIAKVNPTAPIIDVCHALPAFNPGSAAFLLGCVYRDFPDRTIFVCVVDPGVGSARPIIIASVDRYYFVAPDNGILSAVYEDPDFSRVYRVTAEHFYHPSASKTFHGRDIMAPVAGWLSKPTDPSNIGEPTEEYVRIDLPKPRLIGGSVLQGQIMYIDSFGNCVTNVSSREIDVLIANGKRLVRAIAGRREITSFCEYYAQAPVGGEPVCLIGSLGCMEVACNRASASQVLSAQVGTEVGLVFE